MGSLFSVFDPTSSILLRSLNWLSVILFIFFFPARFFSSSRKFFKVRSLAINYLVKEFSMSIGLVKTPGIIHFFISIFILIVFSNFLGLFPYIFTATRHLRITVRLALPVWLGYIVFSTLKNINFFLSHLVPTGTPYPLIPFMVLIEIIRTVIRPLTLSVRLAANIIAGHLLMVLIRGPIALMSYSIIIITLGGLLLLILLELAVSFIQRYVFRTLLSLYIIESNSPNLGDRGTIRWNGVLFKDW